MGRLRGWWPGLESELAIFPPRDPGKPISLSALRFLLCPWGSDPGALTCGGVLSSICPSSQHWHSPLVLLSSMTPTPPHPPAPNEKETNEPFRLKDSFPSCLNPSTHTPAPGAVSGPCLPHSLAPGGSSGWTWSSLLSGLKQPASWSLEPAWGTDLPFHAASDLPKNAGSPSRPPPAPRSILSCVPECPALGYRPFFAPPTPPTLDSWEVPPASTGSRWPRSHFLSLFQTLRMGQGPKVGSLRTEGLRTEIPNSVPLSTLPSPPDKTRGCRGCSAQCTGTGPARNLPSRGENSGLQASRSGTGKCLAVRLGARSARQALSSTQALASEATGAGGLRLCSGAPRYSLHHSRQRETRDERGAGVLLQLPR
ncbi:uncharacterized protein LOC118988856 [Sturnira hondurensis]|uniref:uncharacterized protein LOC118988856 n=1 Tax=Sturnira hondurensis TaxID=192404 RepID=UPI00187A94B2|nr:uncharacterized protein LOC118988856 [Sturnira hondurensis]